MTARPGLAGIDASVMTWLASHPRSSAYQIANATGQTTATARKQLFRLAKAGLVRIEVLSGGGPRTRRVWSVEGTWPAGETMLGASCTP